MSSNIEKIEKMITSLQTGLAELKKQPGDLDNPEKAIAARRELEDKITFYEEQQVLETNRLVAEQDEARKQQRSALLLALSDNAKTVRKQHVQLTKRCTDLIHQLIVSLIERDQIHTMEKSGLSNPELFNLLTNEERSHLRKQWELSTNGFYSGDFSKTWETAAMNLTPENNQDLQHRLCTLVHTSSQFHKALAPITTQLEKAARKMADTHVPVPTVGTDAEDVAAVEPGDHYERDLRPQNTVAAPIENYVGREH